MAMIGTPCGSFSSLDHQPEPSGTISKVNFHPRKKPSIVLSPVRTLAGSVIGRILLENNRRVFDRPVNKGMVFRELDGWPLGAFALEQVLRWEAEAIRYRDGVDVYEAPTPFFLANAIVREFDPGRNPEAQHILPRAWWPVRPAAMPGQTANAVITKAAQIDLFADAAS